MKSLLAYAALALTSCAGTQDWPMFGRDASRNAVTPEKNPPTDWSTVKGKERNIAWSAALGNITMAPPVVADGLVWIGTGNGLSGGTPPKEAGVLHCFRQRDGLPLWRYESPIRSSLPIEAAGYFTAIRSSPLVEGDRLWMLDNRWEVVCFDIGPLKRGEGEPRVLWKTDLIEKTGAWPEMPGMGISQGCSIAAPYRGMIYVSTGNGPSWKTRKPAKPEAPALVCLDAATGEVLAREDSGISGRSVIGNRSSPVTAEFVHPDGREGRLVIFGGGDGILYAFEPVPVNDPKRPGSRILKEVWRVDCNRDGQRTEKDGIIAVPVVRQGRVYALLGKDMFENNGEGNICCVDLATGRKVWNNQEIGLSGCSPVLDGELLYLADGPGYVYGLDVSTGIRKWRHDSLSIIVAPPLVADGFLYVATNDTEMLIFDARSGADASDQGQGTKRPVMIRALPSDVYAAPVFSNRTLYVTTWKRLYAIRETSGDNAPDQTDRVKRGKAPDALFIPTPSDVVSRIADLARIQQKDVLVDLGSGDGRIVIAAAKHRHCRAVGYEIDPDLVERSREMIRKEKLEARVRIEHEDLLKADLTDASVVFLYVGERLNRLLIPKLQKLKPGSRIVSHQFEIPGARPEFVLRVGSSEDGRDHVLYLYTAPLK